MADPTGKTRTQLQYDVLALAHRERRDLLSFMKDVHRRQNGLSPDDIRGIASAWDVTESEVYGVATFYAYLGVRPLGQNVVKVCKSTPCCMKHCDIVAAEVQRVLGIGEGESTDDGRFSLMMVNCIGQCDAAPSIMVNDDVYQCVSAPKVREILDRYSHRDGGNA